MITFALAGVAADASAGAIQTRVIGSMFAPTTQAVYVAEPGETNAVSVRIGGGAVTLRDETAPVSASDGCETVDEHEARCDASSVLLSLGDRDDRAAVEGGFVEADGADGDDRLVAGDEHSDLVGGPGDDQLHGGADGDLLDGGGGRDLLRGMGGIDQLQDGDSGYQRPVQVDDDRLDGGPGYDYLSYYYRPHPMRIDLARGHAGQRGESDQVVGVEDVGGGMGDDHLVGTPRSDALDGALGDDVLVGGPGDDLLDGGPGRDRVRAGRGDDEVAGSGDFDRFSPELGDVIGCGPGRDTVVRPNARDLLDGQCDWAAPGSVDFFRVSVGPVRRRPGGVLVFRVHCVRPKRAARVCRGRIKLHDGRGGFALLSPFHRYGVPRGRSRRVSFDLSAGALRRLRGPRALLQVRVRFGDRVCGSFCHKGWRTRVTPRR